MATIITFFEYLFIGFISCGALDITSVFIYNKLNNNSKYSQNVRWFFIHCIMNMYITVKGLPNLIYSFHNIEKCTTSEWINGYEIYGIAVALHYYHIAFFKLNKMDWLHHITSAIITTPVILYTNTTCLSAVGLWFMSGLPGVIDYLLLWLVKMGYCQKKIEKVAYVAISCWIRAPGCIYTATLQFGIMPHIDQYTWIELIGRFWTTLIVYWNGIYFMHLTLRDYYSNQAIRDELDKKNE